VASINLFSGTKLQRFHRQQLQEHGGGGGGDDKSENDKRNAL
jgi:hypothetical protein